MLAQTSARMHDAFEGAQENFESFFFTFDDYDVQIDNPTLEIGGASEECVGDADGDASVDLVDLNIVLASFGQSTDAGDVTGDGEVDLADLNVVLGAFGTTCE